MPWPASVFTSRNVGPSKHPFPSRQLFVLALCRICEPIAFMSIFPYVYHMVLSFNITSDTHRIAVYVGMVTSAFAFAEFSSSIVWGRISDWVGRKPVLLAGLAGTAFSVILFGFATDLPTALLARALGGLLNGNMGVLQTTVAELVTVKEQQPRAFSIMPFVWCLGSVLGPAMGGALAQPSKTYPTFFPPGSLFDRYPFLLPNLICTGILACGVTIGALFLEETHEAKKYSRRDYGIEAGKWLMCRLKPISCSARLKSTINVKSMSDQFQDTHRLMEEEVLPGYSPADKIDLPGYRTTDGTPRQSSSRCQSPSPQHAVTLDTGIGRSPKMGSGKAFTKQVVLTIAAFGILAYHSISFDQLMPVFLSEPISQDPPSLPFHFSGGFGYSTNKIGFMLAVQGVYSMIAQLFIFPLAARKLGSLNTLRLAIMAWPLLYLVVPYLVLLPKASQEPAVYAALLIKITFHVLAFPSIAITVANTAPSKSVLGLINGAAASTASLARAFGPTLTGVLHSWGLSLGMAGLAWWVCGIICLGGAIESFWMQEVDDTGSGTGRSSDEEVASTEALLDSAAIGAAISAAEDSGTRADNPRSHPSDSKVSCGKISAR